jgi:hypothetical protein
MFTSTTQRFGPNITHKAGRSRHDLLQAKTIKLQGKSNKIQAEKTNNIGKSQLCVSQSQPMQGALGLIEEGSRGKAWQWMEGGKTGAEEIG